MPTEDHWEMGKDAVVFFEKLGFGWVLDGILLDEIDLGNFSDETITNKSLMKIISNILGEKMAT